MQTERYPLPFGWVKELDQITGRYFYVDTKVTPPRSIWVHPYEDDEYLKAHPDVREKLNTDRFGGSDTNLLPPSFEESQRRHSFGGEGSRPQDTNMPEAGSSKQARRGRLGLIKDQLFGTKEERQAEKRRRREEDRARREVERQHIQQVNMARQQYYASQAQCGYDPRFGGPSGFGGYGGYGNDLRRGNGGRGGGLALPLLGGLAGGLLLGEVFDDFGGGGFDGGFF